MKKYLYLLLPLLLLLGGMQLAHAQDTGGSVAPTTANATAPTASGATTDIAPVEQAPIATQPTAAQSTNGNFVLLTNFPAFTSNGFNINAVNFSVFFNNLYKVCIGIAAALALLQIIRAGFTWMTAGDSTERVSQARNLITSSVFGLVLVLSPVIVFTIINPNILNLSLNFSQLGGSATSGAAGTANGTTGTAGTTGAAGTNSAVNPNAAPGTLGAACTTNNDCNGDTVCNDATGACMTDGPNTYSCADDSATNAQGLCANGQPPTNINGDEAPENGSVQPSGSCAGNEDACTNGYTCNDQTSTCTAIPQGGSVGQNGSCAGNVNACTDGLTCDDDTDTCIAATADQGSGASQTYTCSDGTTVDDPSDCTDGSDGSDDSGD